jgi:hypothetical protein
MDVLAIPSTRRDLLLIIPFSVHVRQAREHGHDMADQ